MPDSCGSGMIDKGGLGAGHWVAGGGVFWPKGHVKPPRAFGTVIKVTPVTVILCYHC